MKIQSYVDSWKKMNVLVFDNYNNQFAELQIRKESYKDRDGKHAEKNDVTLEILGMEHLDREQLEYSLEIMELITVGIEAFNSEHAKFQGWMVRPNEMLGGDSPESFINQYPLNISRVVMILNKIETGNFA